MYVSMHVCDLLLLFSDWPEQGKAYKYEVVIVHLKDRSSSTQRTSTVIGCIVYYCYNHATVHSILAL